LNLKENHVKIEPMNKKVLKTLEFDLSSSTFKESHELGGIYDWDEDPDVKTTTTSIGNDKVKKLVRTIEKETTNE
jgi:hypothetical protein